MLILIADPKGAICTLFRETAPRWTDVRLVEKLVVAAATATATSVVGV